MQILDNMTLAANRMVSTYQKILTSSGRLVYLTQLEGAKLMQWQGHLEGLRDSETDPAEQTALQESIDYLIEINTGLGTAIMEAAAALGIDPLTGADTTGGEGPQPDE